jgi:DNA topoisomerase IB
VERARQSEKTTTKAVVEAIKEVAACLGNRPATCKKFYIHPALIAAYESGGELSKRIGTLSQLSGHSCELISFGREAVTNNGTLLWARHVRFER